MVARRAVVMAPLAKVVGRRGRRGYLWTRVARDYGRTRVNGRHVAWSQIRWWVTVVGVIRTAVRRMRGRRAAYASRGLRVW